MANRASRLGIVSRILFILLFSVAACGLPLTQVKIAIRNDARIPESVLAQAVQEASRIFRQAGVDTVWIVCHSSNAGTSTQPDCISPGDLTHLSLRIVYWSSQLGDSTFGIAFLSEEGVGVYSDVFYPLVEKLHSDFGASLSRVLGHVMAHEIGHLLLGLRSHSALGIMQPHWQEEALRRIGNGDTLIHCRAGTKHAGEVTREERGLDGDRCPARDPVSGSLPTLTH